MKKQGQYLTLFQRKLLLKALQSESRTQYRQRIEIMLLADKGCSMTQICKQLRCAQETARYWLEMARSRLVHQWNQHNIGRPKRVSEEYLDRLHELATHSPREYGYCFDRWTAGCLSRHLANSFAIEISERHISRLLKKMGLTTRQKQVNKRRGIAIRDLQPNQLNEPYYLLNLMSIS